MRKTLIATATVAGMFILPTAAWGKAGYLGVQVSPINSDMAAALGLPEGKGELVQAVDPAMAAAKADVRPGDVIVEVNGQTITTTNTLGQIISRTSAGASVNLKILREGEHRYVTAVAGPRPRGAGRTVQQETPESRAQSYVASARAAIAFDNGQRVSRSIGCNLQGGGEIEIARVDGLMQGLVNSQPSFPPYMQPGLARAISNLGTEAGKLRLELADGYLAAGCFEKADQLYRFVLTNFSSPNFAGLRQRAQVGIDDIRVRGR